MKQKGNSILICDSCHEGYSSTFMIEILSQGEIFCTKCHIEYMEHHESERLKQDYKLWERV